MLRFCHFCPGAGILLSLVSRLSWLKCSKICVDPWALGPASKEQSSILPTITQFSVSEHLACSSVVCVVFFPPLIHNYILPQLTILTSSPGEEESVDQVLAEASSSVFFLLRERHICNSHRVVHPVVQTVCEGERHWWCWSPVWPCHCLWYRCKLPASPYTPPSDIPRWQVVLHIQACISLHWILHDWEGAPNTGRHGKLK